MIGAAGELEQTIDNLSIEADVGLQAPAAIDILRKRRDAGRLGEVVVVHIGSNGAFSEEQFEEMTEVLVDGYAASARRPELFVNDGIHLRYEGQRVYTELIPAHLQAP
jgi:hypothetical protein